MLTSTIDENLKDRASPSCIDIAIGKTQVLQALTNGKTFRESNHTLASKLVVVQLKDLNIAVRLWMQHGTYKLTTKSCYLVIQQIELKDGLQLCNTLRHGSNTFVFTEGLPQANSLSMRITMNH